MISVEALEQALYETWTPDQTADMAGWRLYATDGFTRRVNCATGIGTPSTDPDAFAAISAWLVERGADPIVRATPLLDASTVERVVEGWGYRSVDRTLVMTGPVSGRPRDPRIRRVSVLDPSFRAELGRLNGRSSDTDGVRLRMLERIQNRATGLWIPSVAVGLVVASGPTVAVYSVAVDPASRGQGLARCLMAEADAWASERSCDTLFLQVLGTNERAIRLYESLGFVDRYDYHYLEPSDPS